MSAEELFRNARLQPLYFSSPSGKILRIAEESAPERVAYVLELLRSERPLSIAITGNDTTAETGRKEGEAA